MKKMSLLSLIAVICLASQGWAQDCTSGGGAVYYYCDYGPITSDGGGCHKVQHNTDPTGGCIGRLKENWCNPKTSSTDFQGSGTCAGAVTIDVSSIEDNSFFDAPGAAEIWTECPGPKYCKWPDACNKISSCEGGEEDSACAGNNKSCSELEAHCIATSEGKALYSNSTCTSQIATSSSSNNTQSSSSNNNNQSSSSNNNNQSSSSEDSSPIRINIPSIFGLTVVSNANSLIITSGTESKVQLFNINGEKVLSKIVQAGYNSTLSLRGQKQGVYFAVVSSGSNKKTVKIVLK
jgi:hypothetical protein